MNEIWKSTGYEGYEVSNLGRVRSLRTWTADGPYILRATPSSTTGYPVVGLSRPGQKLKMIAVHTLVLEAFVGPRPAGMEARHGVGGRADASLTNLCWGTKRANEHDKQRDHTTNRGEQCGNAKLTWELVCKLRERLDAGEPLGPMSEETGVCKSTLSKIRYRKRWAYPPAEW